jgi:hypothetical protein
LRRWDLETYSQDALMHMLKFCVVLWLASGEA